MMVQLAENTEVDAVRLTPLQQAYFVGANPNLPLHCRAHYYLEFDLPEIDVPRFASAVEVVASRHDLFAWQVTETGTLIPRNSPVLPSVNVVSLDFDATTADELGVMAAQRAILEDASSDTRMAVVPVRIGVTLRADRSARLHFLFSLIYLDGPSIRLLMAEIDAVYRGKGGALSRPVSYIEQLRKLALERATKRYLRAMEFWDGQLATLPEGPDLPMSGEVSGPVTLTRRTRRIAPAVLANLRHLSNSWGVSLAALFLAAYSRVVGAWSSRSHFIVSMMVQANRALNGESRRAVGNLSSMLVVEVDLRERMSLEKQAAKINKTIGAGLLHSSMCGVELLKKKNQADHTLSRIISPVAFVADLDVPMKGTDLEYFSLDHPALSEASLRTPQVLIDHQVMALRDGSLVLNWDSADEVLASGVAEKMFASYHRLLLEVAADPSVGRCDGLSMLHQDEAYFRALANDTRHDYPQCLLHERFFEQALIRPEQEAVIDGEVRLTYGELQGLAHRVAGQLAGNCVEQGDLVVVANKKGWRQVVAILAVLYLGAAYVPVEASLPLARRKAILERSRPVVVLVDANDEEWPEAAQVRSLDELLAHPLAPLPQPARVDPRTTVAYVIFTSGSTGVPKGVVINHAGPVNTIFDVNRRVGLTSEDRVIAISALNFDLSVWDIFGALSVGAAVVFPCATAEGRPMDWLQTLSTHRITVWNSAPALFQMACDYALSKRFAIPPSLRLVMLSGDWVPVDLPGKLRTLTKSAQLVALGGATEASIWSNYHVVSEVPPTWKSIPYGRPLCNQYFHVLDEALNHRPTLVPGELFIGGEGLALEYLEEPELTASAFIIHPETGERLYRTGDLGRYLSNGEIEFLGRRDSQVKVQGMRVELGEIESTITRHPAVTGAVASVIGEGVKSLCVHVATNQAVEKRELHTFVRERLPSYMVPSFIVFIDQIPLSPNGKINRKALPAPTAEVELEATTAIAPGGIEERLGEIWRVVLNVGVKSRDQSFFDLGGDSFAAVVLVAELSRELGIEVPIQALVQHPTIRLLARYIEANRGEPIAIRHTHCLAQHDSKTPLFLVHPSGGTTFCYQNLARELEDHCSVHGIDARGVIPGQEPIAVVEEMAATYLREVEALAAGRPFILGGWSLGGVVATAMAEIATKAGRDLAGLVLIDSPTPWRGQRATDGEMLEWFFSDLLGNASDGSSLGAGGSGWDERFSQAYFAAIDEGKLPNDSNPETIKNLFRLFSTHWMALNNFQPKILEAKVPTLLFKANGRVIAPLKDHPMAGRDDWGWSAFLETTQCVVLPRDHYSIMDSSATKTVADGIVDLFFKQTASR